MDEKHLVACTKYVASNPVRAGLVKSPQDWPWSSAGPHIKGEEDALVKTQPLLDMIQNPREIFLGDDVQRDDIETFRKHERTGRPIGTDSFIKKLEGLLNRNLKPQKPGPETNQTYLKFFMFGAGIVLLKK